MCGDIVMENRKAVTKKGKEFRNTRNENEIREKNRNE